MGSMAMDHSSNFWGGIRSGIFQSWVLDGGSIVRAAGRELENRTKDCGSLWSGKKRGGKSRSPLVVCDAATTTEAEQQFDSIASPRGDRARGVLAMASRSLQASSSGGGLLLASTTAVRNLRFRKNVGPTRDPASGVGSGNDNGSGDGFMDSSLSVEQLVRHPLAIVSLVPKEVSLFSAGAVAGAAAKTVTAPLDRVKLLMQVRAVQVQVQVQVQAARAGVKSSSIGFLETIAKICNEEGVRGLWKGNLAQVIRIIPYSAVQLFAYETYKRILKGDKEQLSVWRRLAAGAGAGMTSTLVTYPLDTIRLRMAVDPASKRMGQVFVNMLRQEGPASFYSGLGPSLLGIAPYIALNFCVFDLIKNSLPEEVRRRPESSLVIALASASFATAVCYPLDTVRRQLQLKGSPFKSVADAFPGIVARDGILGLYRGFVPNALKNLPSSSIRLTTFDAAKNLIAASEAEYDRLLRASSDSSTNAPSPSPEIGHDRVPQYSSLSREEESDVSLRK